MVRHIGGEIKGRFPISQMKISREVLLFALARRIGERGAAIAGR